MSAPAPARGRERTSRARALAVRFGPMLGSLVTAMILWLVVHDLDRSPARFTVPITYEVGPGVVVLSDRVSEVEVQVRATKAKLRQLQPASFLVRVKHAGGQLGRHSVVLDASDVDAPFGVVVERVTPSQFSVTYDRRVTQEVPVRLDLQGRPAAGHEVVEAEISIRPSVVRLSGPESLFGPKTVIRTERVDISDLTKPLDESNVALLPPGPSFTLEPGTDVDILVPIRPTRLRRSFDDIAVEVVEGAWRTSKPNPARLRVTIEGDEAELASLPASAITARVDASDLDPRGEDYHLEPVIEIDAKRCPSCGVASRSQTRVDVTVKAQRVPSRSGRGR